MLNRRTVLAGLPLVLAAGAAEAQAGPAVHVVKTATCGCCNDWVAHLRQAGFRVTVANVPTLSITQPRSGDAIACGGGTPGAIHY